MVSVQAVMAAVNRRLNKLLNVAEAALPEQQFMAFRRCALNEFGRDGLALDLRRLEQHGTEIDNGTERRGPEIDQHGKEVSMRWTNRPAARDP